MSIINLGTQGVRQDFTIEEGVGFTLNFENSGGNFPQGTCAVLTVQYNQLDPSYSFSDTINGFYYQISCPRNSRIDTNTTDYIYQNKRTRLLWKNRIDCNSITLRFQTTRAVVPYEPYEDHTMLSLVDDTISLVYPPDMTTQKRLPVTLFNRIFTWEQVRELNYNNPNLFIVDSYNLFSMLYVTANYELHVITPENRYRPVYGTITKIKPFIAGNTPVCVTHNE